MTDKKISQLTGATTPVAGTEVLPIVQSGSTVKVSIADLTAGRSISTAGASLDGAVTINDSGADVDFRIESDTDANAFFLDGATGNVGIGTNLPSGKFNIDFGNYVGVGARFQFNSSNVPVCINALNNAGDTYLSWNAAAKSSSNTATYVINGGATKIEGGGSQIIFYNAPSGTAGADITFTERLRINSSGGFVFNEPGNDVDFRVEGDNDVNLLFVDASSDRVGIATNSPDAKHHIICTPAIPAQKLTGTTNAQGTAQKITVVRHYPVVSLGTKLIIPFFNQGVLNSTTICKVWGHGARYNTRESLGFEITFCVGNVSTTLDNLVSWGGNGNYSSIAVNGNNIEITFTTAYTSATADGIFATIEFMCNDHTLTVDVANIAMN